MPGEEFDDGLGEIGGELDMDAVTRVSSEVKRKPLDLGLGDLLPRQSRSGGRESGGGALDGDTFMDREQKEAVARARGGTPTLDRLGVQAVQPTQGSGAEMDRRLNLQRQGIPTWGWILMLLGTFAVGFGIFMAWLWASRTTDVNEEAARLQAAQERAQQLEGERQAGME
ncbi:MAG: hypothetical protein P1V51_21120 [Deltaproteobacteria bacterium]|nr:hypothetical protein [Deltaproteobacteria bacterium]